MPNEIISYLEMCRRENASLQRGMNFGLAKNHSVILMSVRRGAPYRDYLDGDGSVLLYEGHDEPQRVSNLNPKQIDQGTVLLEERLRRTGYSCAQLRTTRAES